MLRLQINNLSLTYSDKVIFENLNLDLEEGRYLIQGHNGIGKTTLLNLIAGYIFADKGKVVRNGSVFYMFQDETFFSNLTVKENLFIFFKANKIIEENLDKKIDIALKELEISNLKEQKIASLSGGERQKVELAKLKLVDADIILMDEPTSKLDVNIKNEIYEKIIDFSEGKTLLIVSHEDKLFSEGFKKILLTDSGVQYG